MTPSLSRLRALGRIEAIDVELSRTLSRLSGDAAAEVLLGVALASASTREGHVCAELGRFAGEPVRDEEGQALGDLHWPPLSTWVSALAASDLVGRGEDARPLLLDLERARLYLRRYWAYERRLAALLSARARELVEVDEAALREGLSLLFPNTSPGDGQRRAALVALFRRFAVISGGPGTGKTSTVVKLLALLVKQAEARGERPPSMVLLAPTGKAAGRLSESIQKAKGSLPYDATIKAAITEEASTIHRGLRPLRGGGARFRHNADNPLAADVVIVDEASMVDLSLMVKLVEAVPAGARLYLLGDRDQLSSVDAGAVLGDICNAESKRGFSRSFARRLEEVEGAGTIADEEASEEAGVWDCVVHLSRSYRYGHDSGIGALARAINRGDAAEVREILGSGRYPDVVQQPLDEAGASLGELVVEGYGPYISAKGPEAALEAFGRFRVLCAHRRGMWGVEEVGRQIERALSRAGRLHRDRGTLYSRQPILVTSNDYDVRLFNGDIGVVLEDEEGGWQALRAFFVGAKGELRRIAVSRLPPHESAFAMTVHKSQGSEFDEVVVVLPEGVSPILSRELLYTAVTRARKKVTILGSLEVVAEAVERRIQRATGLREILWGE